MLLGGRNCTEDARASSSTYTRDCVSEPIAPNSSAPTEHVQTNVGRRCARDLRLRLQSRWDQRNCTARWPKPRRRDANCRRDRSRALVL